MSGTPPPDPAIMVHRFHALADPKRLHILELLRGGERCVCYLVTELGTSQPLLSFHLRILREAGLVSDRRDRRWVHYSLVPGAVAEMEEAAGALRRVTHSSRTGCEGACCCP